MIDIILYVLLIFIVVILIYIIFNFLYDYLSFKTENSNKIEDTNKNFKTVDNNINKLYNFINDTDKKIINDYTNTISANYNGLNCNISILSNNDTNISNNFINFDSALKKYFIFSENSNNTSYNNINDALYKYTFNSLTPKLLNIISKVNAINGMTILTAPSLTNSNNLRICDNSSTPNCLNISVSNSNFNIMPENPNASKIIMNNNDGSQLATFDMYNKIIKLGQNQTNNDSAMYIINDNVFVKKINFINDNNFYKDSNINSFNDTTTTPFNINNINSLNNINNNVICYYNIINNDTVNILTINFISEITIPNNSYLTIKIPEISQNQTSIPSTSIGSIGFINPNTIKINITNSIVALTNTSISINTGFNVNSGITLPINNIAYGTISNT